MSLSKSGSLKGLNFHRILIYSIFRKFPTICPRPPHPPPPVLPTILYSLRKRQMLLVIIHLIEQVFPYIYAFRRYVRIIILIAMCFFLHLNFDGDHHIYILSYCSIRVRRSMSIYIYLWYWETKPRSIDLDEIFCLEIWCYRWLRQNSSQWFFFFSPRLLVQSISPYFT